MEEKPSKQNQVKADAKQKPSYPDMTNDSYTDIENLFKYIIAWLKWKAKKK